MTATSWTRPLLLGAVLLTSALAPALAQTDFPTKTVHILNAFPPGGPSDIISRVLAEKMTATLKQTVLVENKPGAGGNIAAAEVAKSPADGYTILSGIDTTFTINPAIYKQMPFDLKDLKPLLVMASSGLLVGTHPSVGAKSLADLVAKAKAEPMLFSSGSNGSPGHLAASILVDSTGAKITHVPYKGNSPAVMAVLSGEVQAGVLATPGMMPHVQAGKVKAIGFSGYPQKIFKFICDQAEVDCVLSYNQHTLQNTRFSDETVPYLKAKGVEKSKPEHAAQMQVYMHLAGLERAFYLAVNKDTD